MIQIDNYDHRPGLRAGTTALANLMRHRGVDVSEAMAFGIGGGLHFRYDRAESSPSRRIDGRAPALEQTAAEALGFAYHSRKYATADQVRETLTEALQDDHPVMACCVRASFPFVADAVVVIGYDTATDRLRIAGHLADALEVPFATFQKDADAWQLSWLQGDGEAPTKAHVDAGIDRMQQQMDDDGGLEQLRQFADEVAGWGAEPDGAACFRLAHSRIVGDGNGSLHRGLAREFIGESRERFPGIFGVQLGIGVTKCAQGWNTLADYLLAAAESAGGTETARDPLHHVESVAEAIYQYESAFTDLVSYR